MSVPLASNEIAQGRWPLGPPLPTTMVFTAASLQASPSLLREIRRLGILVVWPRQWLRAPNRTHLQFGDSMGAQDAETEDRAPFTLISCFVLSIVL